MCKYCFRITSQASRHKSRNHKLRRCRFKAVKPANFHYRSCLHTIKEKRQKTRIPLPRSSRSNTKPFHLLFIIYYYFFVVLWVLRGEYKTSLIRRESSSSSVIRATAITIRSPLRVLNLPLRQAPGKPRFSDEHPHLMA